MLIPPLASLGALAERLGSSLNEPASTDGVRALAALDDASALIRSEAGIDWLDDEGALESVPAIVESICLAVAYRAFRNPDGATQSSVGDVSVSYARAGTSGAIYLSRAEQRAIRNAGGRSGLGAIVLESAHPLGSRDNLYAPAEGDMIPLGPVPWEGF